MQIFEKNLESCKVSEEYMQKKKSPEIFEYNKVRCNDRQDKMNEKLTKWELKKRITHLTKSSGLIICDRNSTN